MQWARPNKKLSISLSIPSSLLCYVLVLSGEVLREVVRWWQRLQSPELPLAGKLIPPVDHGVIVNKHHVPLLVGVAEEEPLVQRNLLDGSLQLSGRR